MGFFKDCDYEVPFVFIPKDELLQGNIWCGVYKEFLHIPEHFYNRFSGEYEYVIDDEPHIVRGIKWNNMHFSSIRSDERHCRLPPMSNNYYKDTDKYKVLKALQDEFRENKYGRVTKYLFGDEAVPNQQAPAHWFNNFKIWVIGWEYYERPFASSKWGNFKK